MAISRSSLIRSAVGISLLGLVLAFAARQLIVGAAAINQAALADNLPLLAAAVVVLMGATLLLGVGWIAVLESITPDDTHHRRELLLAFAYSWLARYVPGTIPFLAGRIYLGSRVGYGTRPLIVSTAVQNVLELLVCTILGASMIVASQGSGGSGAFVALAFVPLLGLCALHPAVLRRIIDLSLRVLRREPLGDAPLPSMNALLASSALVVTNQMLNGLALLALLHIVAGAGWNEALLTSGALSLAGAAGVLVVLVPAGLGVRDATLTALLSSRFVLKTAATAAILLRLLNVIADLLLFALAFVVDIVGGTRVAARAFSGEPAIRVVPAPARPVPVATPDRRSA